MKLTNRQDAVAALERIAHILEREREPTYRVRAFRNAAAVVRALPDAEFEERSTRGTLSGLAGIGPVTAQVIAEALTGTIPEYLQRLETEAPPIADDALALRRALRGDCHVHSDWSDGGSPIEEMARTAIALGHEYIVLTDHSPRLTVARGLSAERLREQLDVVRGINERLVPFRILTGIEVDILEDGALDQEPDLLAQLDVVVASVHSKLRMPRAEMTPRMIAAIRNPHMDILGHCTGRIVVGRGRPESEFDADAVFAECREHRVAVEINSRPERLDPPTRLLKLAVATGCRLALDTDAHAPGQLEWQLHGCQRAANCGVSAEMVINTMPASELVAWTRMK
ncbi:MAG TPA: PHP domain-containing protein [Candidatus Acidoferrales bacterium]|jgi:putative hydrolase|nr:PHP domain-containing protein [Candidatus Acidoferrales bacterium]